MNLRGRTLPLRKRAPLFTPVRLVVLVLLALAGGAWWFRDQLTSGALLEPFVATATPTRSARSFGQEAVARFAAGDFSGAVVAYEAALAGDPNNAELLVGMARAQMFAENNAGALETARRAVALAPASAHAQAILAWALWSSGDLDAANEAATEAVAADDTSALAHAVYSLILNSQAAYDQGFREAQRALALDDRLIESYYALGNANEAQGAWQNAIGHYENGLRLNPNVIFLHRKIGINYRALGFTLANESPLGASDPGVLEYFSRSIDSFNRAIAINRQYVVPYLDLARTYIMIDQLGAAEQTLQEALRQEPNNPAIHGRLGVLRLQLRNYEGAIQALHLAVEGGTYQHDDGLGTPLVVEVQGLPLDARSLEFYYSYGNALARALRCGPGEAPYYLQRAFDFAPEDPVVVGSYEASAYICRHNGTATPTPEDEAPPPAPVLDATPVPPSDTPTP
jgi:tetratricopeptide (TPR) repeat protein